MDNKINLKPLVNDPVLWKSFKDYINFSLGEVQRGLEQAASVETIYRLQGKADFCRRLLLLREEINGERN